MPAASERAVTASVLADLAEQVVQAGARARLAVRGGSMYPCIRDGDVVEIVPTAPEHTRPGHVVLCRTEGGRPVVHRVVAVETGASGRRLLLRGDALPGHGETAPLAALIGRVVAVERRGRRHSLTGPSGWLWSRRLFRRGVVFALGVKQRLGALYES